MSRLSAAPGSSQYLPSLLGYVRRNRPDLDARLFTAILLCLVAGERNLLVRTEENDIADVATAAVNILVSLFGLPTQRVQARKQDDPHDFLTSMFLVPPHSRSSSHTPKSSRKQSGNRRRASPMKPKLSTTTSTAYDSSSSSSSTTTDTQQTTLLSPVPYRRKLHASHLSAPTRDSASIHGLRPQSGHGYPIETSSRVPTSSDMQTRASQRSAEPSWDGFPPGSPNHASSISRHSTPLAPGMSPSRLPKLPHALVLTKIERAGFATQTALWEVLRTRTISLAEDPSQIADGQNLREPLEDVDDDGEAVFNLPSGFFAISVCALGDGKQTPPIPPFLIDMFAFSSTVLLESPASVVPSIPPGLTRTSSPLLSIADIEDLRSAAMHHTHISHTLSTYLMNLFLATRHHSHLNGTLLSARCVRDMDEFVRSARVLFGPPESPTYSNGNDNTVYTGAGGLDRAVSGEMHMCTEKDVARVFAGVLAHRLAVRTCGPLEGPLSSLLVTAVDVPVLGGASEDVYAVVPDDSESKATVYGILAAILRSI